MLGRFQQLRLLDRLHRLVKWLPLGIRGTKLVYDGGNGAQSSMVPYLPLSELTPRRTPSPPATTQQQGGTR